MNMTNLFDSGKRVASGGYNFPLSGWREYYTLNVIGTHAITHEAFCREFPEAALALKESDARNAKLEALLANPNALAIIAEVIDHLGAGKAVSLLEAAPIAEADAPAADKPSVPDHQHKMNVDTQGNGTTDNVNGHAHDIKGGECMTADGHTHDMPKAAQTEG